MVSLCFLYILDLPLPRLVQYVQKTQTHHVSIGSDHVLSTNHAWYELPGLEQAKYFSDKLFFYFNIQFFLSDDTVNNDDHIIDGHTVIHVSWEDNQRDYFCYSTVTINTNQEIYSANCSTTLTVYRKSGHGMYCSIKHGQLDQTHCMTWMLFSI